MFYLFGATTYIHFTKLITLLFLSVKEFELHTHILRHIYIINTGIIEVPAQYLYTVTTLIR